MQGKGHQLHRSAPGFTIFRVAHRASALSWRESTRCTHAPECITEDCASAGPQPNVTVQASELLSLRSEMRPQQCVRARPATMNRQRSRATLHSDAEAVQHLQLCIPIQLPCHTHNYRALVLIVRYTPLSSLRRHTAQALSFVPLSLSKSKDTHTRITQKKT